MQSLCDYPEKINSLGEVQRIIGLSLSKIQVGRNQRGGLPLHKNLLVATVLNKARDLYMQETMYMNYKLMTGHQFGMAASASSDSVNNMMMANNDGASTSTASMGNGLHEEEMEDATPEQEDYEEDSESDVEDDEPRSCELASPRAALAAASMVYPASTMAAMMMQAAAASVAASSAACSGLLSPASGSNESGRLTPINPSAMNMQNVRMNSHYESASNASEEDSSVSHHDAAAAYAMHGSFQHLHHLSQLHHHQQQQQQQQQLQLQQQHQEQQAAVMAAAHAQAAAVAVAAAAAAANQQQQHQQLHSMSPAGGSDEGFIDEPDCDCDARNFSTMETRVPFRYCYRCAPFQSANGRGPTLVPSPSSCPSLSSEAGHTDDEDGLTPLSTFQPANKSETSGSTTSTGNDLNGSNNFTIYDMDSKSTERRAPCDATTSTTAMRHANKRRRKLSDTVDGNVDVVSTKKRRSSESEATSAVVVTSASSSCQISSQLDTFHPAFRGTESSATTSTTTTATTTSSTMGPATMEIDQITSLVSIFSFGQHLINAGNITDSPEVTGGGQLESSAGGCEGSSSSGSSSGSGSKAADDDSDSESDTSSDSGHSSDDHDTSSDKEMKEDDSVVTGETVLPSEPVLTKLTRSVSTPELCSTSSGGGMDKTDSPICVQVASI